jgi:peptidoglycan/xylan/chitin deacetylase (PgdA/CDA1 family)
MKEGFSMTGKHFFCLALCGLLAAAPAGADADLQEAPVVPVLMYHHFVEDTESVTPFSVRRGTFWAHMRALKDNGYTALTVSDLVAFVDGEAEWPEKPVMVTMDDGYLSNYQIAYPILRSLGLRATVAALGGKVREASEGRADLPTPKFLSFTLRQAQEMQASGVMDVQSHTYALHGEISSERHGASRRPGESADAYAETLLQDHRQQLDLLGAIWGENPKALFYPYGQRNAESDRLYRQMGYRVTFQTGGRFSRVRRGDPGSLFGLCRKNVTDDVSPEGLLALIDG